MGPLVNIDDREEFFLVGRVRERERFERFLTEGPGRKQVWSLYGTGGIGKSTLLDMYRRQARKRGAAYLLLDGREAARSETAFCRKLLELLNGSAEEAELPDRVFALLNRLAQERRVVVAIDTFEEIGSLEGWIREHFVSKLHADVLFIAAGRYPLKGPWMLSPAWRGCTEWIALDHLSRTEVHEYARRCGIADVGQAERLWERTQGHGLSLSLAVSAELLGNEGPLHATGWSSELVSLWLKEVPDEELRNLVEAASALRLFNQEMLEYVTERSVGAQAFARLTELSFVRKSNKGWRLHDLMRDSTRSVLRERSPAKFERLMGRCVLYYATVILESYRKRDVAAEVGELFHYIGNERIRAFLSGADSGEYVWEPLAAGNLEEGVRYLERRRNEATAVTRRGTDPITGAVFEQSFTKEEMLYVVAGLDLEELLALRRQSVMLMRSREGLVCGLSAIIPIHRDTLPYLEQDPFSGPYIRSLSPDERQALDAEGSEPSGWFIRSIDVWDWNDTSMLLAAVAQMYSYMCAGKLFFATPPPLEMHYQSHLGLGFEIVPGVTHCSYDGKTATPTFVLDTRGEKLEAFLSAMLRRGGVELERSGTGTTREPMQPRLAVFGLTEREREVVQLVMEGCSNAEIAERLFVSEVTVKKHLSSVYGKTKTKNRSQLIKVVLQ